MTGSYLGEEVVHEGLVLHGDLHLVAAGIALLLKHENTKHTEVLPCLQGGSLRRGSRVIPVMADQKKKNRSGGRQQKNQE